jgi:hypothetical protein
MKSTSNHKDEVQWRQSSCVKLKGFHALDYVLSHGGSQSRDNEGKRIMCHVFQQIVIEHMEDQHSNATMYHMVSSDIVVW